MIAFGGLETDRYTGGPQIPPVNRTVRQSIKRIAIALGPFARQTNVEPIVHNGKIDHAFEPAVLVISEVGGSHRFELVGGFGAGEVHHARRRITAVERALWAAQNFDLRNVVEFLFEEVIADKRHVVERDGDRRIGCHGDRLRADAANLDAVTS